MRIGARMMLQAAIEEEVTAYLGRDYYERNERANGSRKGSKPRTIKALAMLTGSLKNSSGME